MYKKIKHNDVELENIIKVIEDDKVYFIPNDPNNIDWQKYQEWLAADPANQPEEAD